MPLSYSNRPAGVGSLDIYRSSRDGDVYWVSMEFLELVEESPPGCRVPRLDGQ